MSIAADGLISLRRHLIHRLHQSFRCRSARPLQNGSLGVPIEARAASLLYIIPGFARFFALIRSVYPLLWSRWYEITAVPWQRAVDFFAHGLSLLFSLLQALLEFLHSFVIRGSFLGLL